MIDLGPLFPGGVEWKIAEDWMWETPVCAAEEALIAKAVDKRKREFRAGRNCAHHLFNSLGVPCDALLKGKQREPAWPAGWVGSISHTQGLCVVALAPTAHYRSIGLDVEQASPLGEEIRDLICSPAEQDMLTRLRLQLGQELASHALDKLIFSAKESIHKTYFPLNYHTLDFLDAKVEIEPSNSAFTATIIKPEPAPTVPIRTLQGNYCFDRGYVATFISLKSENTSL
ncbi:4'-phosphopantetheinyl transferase [Ketobacter sp.]|uniref:4'-phosphopantetheinyl transferase family protein n=1 Tax=Ketobacter sp. TaxID=2083498 RepID=UPI000F1C60B3|nr:4'-phosphopantetheinyl transferase superfamily protein [Ketobacter sp.]RLT97419.1 MAG: 4'-phosphopantetheinyl transferase superfamily protein [Ketobacter sp.]